jgi:5-methylcytosine-specific restriction protein A
VLPLFNIFCERCSVEELFLGVFDHYFKTRIRLGGKANVIGTPDQNALLIEIPGRIETYLNEHKLSHLFKVKGSIGNGNIARIPWIGVFRKDITENAENGYYIVLLFSENMNCCYLSLNQGVTAIEQLYTKRFALRKMREAASQAAKSLEVDPEACYGAIDLASTGDLGRAYEAAAIVSFRYSSNTLPTEEEFFTHLGKLLKYYEELYRVFGKSLNSLISVSEGEFQQVVLEKAAQFEAISRDERLSPLLHPVSPSVLGLRGHPRSPIVAAEAISVANFCCEIDPEHWSFTSKAKKQRYVEAHHLVPISHRDKFPVPLDIVENIVSLCATCHRMLHYGAEKERKPILVSLFKQRKKRLLEKSINIETSEFLRLYAPSEVFED